ncbi:tetratricopeptide repeat protein [Mesorhizobium sp. C395A]|nr:tetratricopeptide repeat protein [Mesorhizobium sp. C395A]
MQLRKSALPADHPDVASSFNNLARLCQDQGRRYQDRRRQSGVRELWNCKTCNEVTPCGPSFELCYWPRLA